MTPSNIRTEVVSDRIAWVRDMFQGIKGLPLDTYEAFAADPRNAAAAESYLRRALEALLDIGRHVLAKGFGRGAQEYKEIPTVLREQGVLTKDQALLMRRMAGYRNRMVHFYHEVSKEELYELCSGRLDDVELVLEALRQWIREHPEKLDQPFE